MATPTTYTVRSGDSLSLIARNVLGDVNRWPEIARLNGLVSPYTLTVGRVLKLPTSSADAATGGSQDTGTARGAGYVYTLSDREASSRLTQLQSQLTDLANRMRVALQRGDVTTLNTLRNEYRALSQEAAALRQQINASEAPSALLTQLDTFSDRVLEVGRSIGEIPAGIGRAFKYLPVIIGGVAVVALVLAFVYFGKRGK